MKDKNIKYYKELVENAEAEIPEYFQEANNILGLTLITIIGIIISSKHPLLLWVIFLPLVLGLMKRMWNRFPPALNKLRREKKRTKNLYKTLEDHQLLTEQLRKFEKKYFGIKPFFTEHILYTYGTISYWIIGICMFFDPGILKSLINI